MNHMTRLLTIEPRLPVSNLKASCRFYCDNLGFSCPSGDPSTEEGFLILGRDGVRLQFVMADEHHPAARLTIWLGVEDARVEHDRLKNRTRIEWGPEVYWYGCREFAVLDPDGHRIIFSSPTDEPPTCGNER